jgi:predicted protein tyrosine phosphatase
MIEQVTFLSEPAALLLEPSTDAALISITEPNREARLQNHERWGDLLRVRFVDAEYDAEMLARLHAAGDTFDPVAKGFPSAGPSWEIRQFLDRLKSHPEIVHLFVHCKAGKRRSAAVAKYASELYGLENDQEWGDYNQTVYALLCNPEIYSMARGDAESNGFGHILKRLMSIVIPARIL